MLGVQAAEVFCSLDASLEGSALRVIESLIIRYDPRHCSQGSKEWVPVRFGMLRHGGGMTCTGGTRSRSNIDLTVVRPLW